MLHHLAAKLVAGAAVFGAGAYAWTRVKHGSNGGKPSRKAGGGASASAVVMHAQQELNSLGYTDASGAPLVEDGVEGPKTDAAVSAFQNATGIAATGRLDAATVAALDNAANGNSSTSGGGFSNNPSPPASATDAGGSDGGSTANGILSGLETGTVDVGIGIIAPELLPALPFINSYV